MEKTQDSKTPDTQANWNYSSGDDDSAKEENFVSAREVKPVSWTASEFVAYSKDASWYIVGSLCLVGLSGVIFVLTNYSWLSSLLVLIAGAIFMVAAGHNPRTLDYSISSDGLQIDSKLYTYDRFKSFSIIQEGAINSIALQPLERFMPSITIYYEPKDEEKIAQALSVFLPYEQRQISPVDKFMTKIRF